MRYEITVRPKPYGSFWFSVFVVLGVLLFVLANK